MSSYAELLKTPGVARIIAAQLTARFPSGMLSLAYLLHIERIHDSYGAAGLVLAATSIGQAIAGPLTSRWMGVWSMRKVLVLTMVVCAISIGAMAFLVMPVYLYMVVGFISGLSTTTKRQGWTLKAEGASRTTSRISSMSACGMGSCS